MLDKTIVTVPVYFAVLGLLYSIFIFGALFKIVWEYLGIKDREKHQ